MKITIQANTLELSQKELKERLTPAQIQAAKGKSLVAYTIAEEGESHPVVLGQGENQNLIWPRAVIQKIQATVKAGTKLFNRHNSDNSHNGRNSVGEVLTTFTKDLGGRLRAISIAALEKADAAIYDICSIEADIWEISGIVGDVDQVTGIAVSNSKIDTPAFANAKRMQTVQCFTDPGKQDSLEKEKTMPATIEDLMSVPFDTLKQAISARKIFPSQLYDLRDFEGDRELSPIFKERADLTSKVTDLEKELGTTKEEAAAAVRKGQTATAKDLLASRIPNGTTEAQKTFISKKFDPEKMETIDETAIDQFIKEAKTEFQDMAKIFGAPSDNNGSDEGQNTVTEEGTDMDSAFLEE